jgi:hypothetical protein
MGRQRETPLAPTTIHPRQRPLHSVKQSGGSRPPTFHGPHLWINHDQSHMQALPNRHRVTTHLQRHYRPWKRRESSKALLCRSSAKTRLKQGDREDEPPSPTSILANGNSDPCAVYPVKVGRVENQLIAFCRDTFLPAQYGIKQKLAQYLAKAQYLANDWQNCVRGLSDEHMFSKSNPFVGKVAMEHQWRSTQLLRKKVDRGQNLQPHDNYLHINMLYSAETISGNLNGALAHRRMFRSLFNEAWRTGSLSYILFQWQFNNDIQTSTTFLVRPVFDVDGFVPMIYAPIRAQLEEEDMPSVDGANDNIDPSITGSLGNIFRDTRELWELRNLREKQGRTDSATPAFVIWRFSQEPTFLGRFMNHYLYTKQ